jgi:hypothetical protein
MRGGNERVSNRGNELVSRKGPAMKAGGRGSRGGAGGG